jgi:hypothetical protein
MDLLLAPDSACAPSGRWRAASAPSRRLDTSVVATAARGAGSRVFRQGPPRSAAGCRVAFCWPGSRSRPQGCGVRPARYARRRRRSPPEENSVAAKWIPCAELLGGLWPEACAGRREGAAPGDDLLAASRRGGWVTIGQPRAGGQASPSTSPSHGWAAGRPAFAASWAARPSRHAPGPRGMTRRPCARRTLRTPTRAARGRPRRCARAARRAPAP